MPSTPWFFTALAPDGKQHNLDETNSRHAVQVLRMQAGEPLILTNGLGTMWNAEVNEPHKKECGVRILNEIKLPRQTIRKVGIGISPVKNNVRLEWFLEKATELGVSDIFLIQGQRTEKPHIRFDRLVNITISAMLQSQQVWMPNIHPSQPLEKWLPNTGYHHRWVAHCEDLEKHHLAKVLKDGMEDSLVLIGPEGDFTREEIALAMSHQFNPVSLGDTRLRTETAGIVAATLCCLV